MLWMLFGMCHTAAFAYGYDRDAQSQKWGYQPVHNFQPSQPEYQFYSTSPYSGSVGDSKSGSFVPSSVVPRRKYIPGGPAVGEVEDTPIGDTPWFCMLLLTAGYIAFRVHRRREA